MKIRILAWITFLALLRNRLIILFFAIFVCIVLLMMTPLMTTSNRWPPIIPRRDRG